MLKQGNAFRLVISFYRHRTVTIISSKLISFAGLITYSTDKHLAANLETISAQRAQQIIAMNRRGEKPLSLPEDNKSKTPNKPKDLLEDDINRFDKAKHKKKKRPTGRNNKNRHSKQCYSWGRERAPTSSDQ